MTNFSKRPARVHDRSLASMEDAQERLWTLG